VVITKKERINKTMNKTLYECTAFNSAGLIAMQSKATNEIDAIRYCKTDLRDKLWKSKTQFFKIDGIMLTTGYLIAIGLFVFGFVILALIWLLNTMKRGKK
jgi:hypothetical protein